MPPCLPWIVRAGAAAIVAGGCGYDFGGVTFLDAGTGGAPTSSSLASSSVSSGAATTGTASSVSASTGAASSAGSASGGGDSTSTGGHGAGGSEQASTGGGGAGGAGEGGAGGGAATSTGAGGDGGAPDCDTLCGNLDSACCFNTCDGGGGNCAVERRPLGSDCGADDVCGEDGACVACISDETCATPLTGCRRSRCLSNVCIEEAMPVGTLCNDTGDAGRCDSASRCVECTENEHCSAGTLDTCIAGKCERAACGNGMDDADEVGVDCGGACSARCDHGTVGCEDDQDCLGQCSANLDDPPVNMCFACSATLQCADGQWCSGGNCILKDRVGDPCPADSIGCTSLACADGVCCNEACAGATRSCLSWQTGEQTGLCNDVVPTGPGYDACGP